MRRILRTGLLAMALLGLAGVAVAAEGVVGEIEAVSLERSTVTIGGEDYRFGATTIFRTREGLVVTADRLPFIEEKDGVLFHVDEATCRYVARGNRLLKLRLIEPPR